MRTSYGICMCCVCVCMVEKRENPDTTTDALWETGFARQRGPPGGPGVGGVRGVVDSLTQGAGRSGQVDHPVDLDSACSTMLASTGRAAALMVSGSAARQHQARRSPDVGPDVAQRSPLGPTGSMRVSGSGHSASNPVAKISTCRCSRFRCSSAAVIAFCRWVHGAG